MSAWDFFFFLHMSVSEGVCVCVFARVSFFSPKNLLREVH